MARTDNSSVAGVNGVGSSSSDSPKPSASDAFAKPLTELHEQQSVPTPSNSGWTEASTQPEDSTVATSVSGTGSALGVTPAALTEVNGTTHSPHVTTPSKQPSKSPATSKLSWAQIAR